MSDLLVAGLAYLEVFAPPGCPPPGQEQFVDEIGVNLGGALNAASVAAALGLDVTLAAPCGNGVADLALGAVTARLGIHLAPLPARDDPAVSLVYVSAGERSFLSAADLAALDAVEELPQARWVLVPGLEEAARLAAPLLRARARGARIAVCGSWNPARLDALDSLRGQPWDLLVLNQPEAEHACGDIQRALVRLTEAAASVVVTCGAAGARARIHGMAVHSAALPVQAIDSTGAGDAFCATLVAALMAGRGPAEAMREAARAGAFIVQQRGGLLATRARMDALAREVRCAS